MNTFLLTVMSCLLVTGHSVPVPTFAPSEDVFLENADETIPVENGGDEVRVHEISLEDNEPVTTIQVEELVTVIIDVQDSGELTTNRDVVLGSESVEEPEEVQSEEAADAVVEDATTSKTALIEGAEVLSFIHSHDQGVVEEVVTDNVMATVRMTEAVPEEEETEEVVDETIHIEADVHIEGGNNGGKFKVGEIRIDLVREDVVDAVSA